MAVDEVEGRKCWTHREAFSINLIHAIAGAADVGIGKRHRSLVAQQARVHRKSAHMLLHILKIPAGLRFQVNRWFLAQQIRIYGAAARPDCAISRRGLDRALDTSGQPNSLWIAQGHLSKRIGRSENCSRIGKSSSSISIDQKVENRSRDSSGSGRRQRWRSPTG